MRTTHELLKVVLDEFERGENYIGICECIEELYFLNKITTNERKLIHSYMRKGINTILYFWWPPYEKQPRIEWLKEHIEKTK